MVKKRVAKTKPATTLSDDAKLAATVSPAEARITANGEWDASSNPSPAEQVAEQARNAAIHRLEVNETNPLDA